MNIYYVLPGTGIYGGVKNAFQTVEYLNRAGYTAFVATPEGGHAQWLDSCAKTVPRERLPDLCVSEDMILFSWPPDADFVSSLKPARKIVHMQGANTPADEQLMLRRDEFEFISHGLHMTQRLLAHGIVAPYVPLSVSPVFRCQDRPKQMNSIAYMPRKNGEAVDRLRSSVAGDPTWLPISDLPESQVAAILQRADMFVAVSPNEAFGLPPLEAMCSGCCVVGYPGDGGFEFMRHGETAHVVTNNDERGLLFALQHCLEHPDYRDYLRLGGLQLAAYYTPERESRGLLRALGL